MSIQVAQLRVDVEVNGASASSSLRQVDNDIRNLESSSSRMSGTVRTAVGTATGFLGAQLVQSAGAAAIAGVKMGMSYETALDTMQEVAGATDAQMKAVGNTARSLGSDLSLPATSASDAGTAMVELAKAGLSVEQSMSAAKGVLQLAAAAQIDEASAATLTATALNAFHLQGSEAVRVADLLSGAANASAAEITDVGAALQMSASVFASAKIPVQELVTAIAEMSNAGIQGSDAGTSLKTMLLALQSPSKEAAATLADLGIKVYDAKGAMLPFQDLIGQFTAKMGPLTAAQRDQALATVFGSDAVRAANVVMLGGVDAFTKLEGAVTKQGAAGDLAAAKTKGLGGALAGLQSQIETGLLAAYERAAPAATEFIRGLAEGLPGAVSTAMSALAPIGSAISSTFGPLAGVARDILAGLAPMVPVIQSLAVGFGAVVVGAAGLAAAVLSVLDRFNVLTPIATALAVLIGGRLVASFIAWGVQATAAALRSVAAFAINQAWAISSSAAAVVAMATQIAQWVVMGATALASAAEVALAWIIAMGPIGLVIAAVVGLVVIIVRNWDTIKAATSAAWEWVKNAVSTAVDFIVGLFMRFTLPGLIISHWDTIRNATMAVWNAITGFLSGVWNAITGAASAAWNAIVSAVSGAWNAVRTAVSGGIGGVLALVRGLPGQILGALGNIAGILFDAGRSVIQGFVNGIRSMISAVAGVLGGIARSITSWKGPPAKDAVILVPAGKLVMGGFVDGIEAATPMVRRALQGVTDMVGRAGSASVSATSTSTPPGSSAGGSLWTGNLVVQGSVQTERDLAQHMQEALADLQQRQGTLAFAR